MMSNPVLNIAFGSLAQEAGWISGPLSRRWRKTRKGGKERPGIGAFESAPSENLKEVQSGMRSSKTRKFLIKPVFSHQRRNV